MIIRSKAPLRISFAGGGTDVDPYASECGGCVLSTTIDKYAYASLRMRDDDQITVSSLDYDVVAKYQVGDELVYDNELDLVKAVLKTVNADNKLGFDFFLHSDAPPGSGLGSSSTMVVALMGALRKWRHLPLAQYDIAKLAYHIERVELGIQGGMQDQYAAVFGGFNFMEFSENGVIVNPLRVQSDVINELNYNLLLCYTGKTRLSGHIIQTQVDGYVNREVEVLDAMNELKGITIEMKNCLLQGDLPGFGKMMNAAWFNKKRMAKQITTPMIDELYETAKANGAIGGKVLGAGGGGFMMFYCEFGKKHLVAQALEKVGGEVVDFGFDSEGVQAWTARSDNDADELMNDSFLSEAGQQAAG